MSIRLRPLADSDSDLLFRWINTPDLVMLSAPFKPVAQRDHDAWFAGVRGSGDQLIYAIASLAEDRTIGYCQLKKIDPVSANAELQIRIGDPSMQGRGAGTTAVRALLDVAFGKLALHRVYLHVLASNERARRTYVACGFSEEGVLREAVRIAGRFEDLVMMAILAREQR